MSSFITERNTPSEFDMWGDDKCPQRLMSNFVITRNNEKISICALDDHSQSTESHYPIVAKGTLTADKQTLRVETEPLIEWCIEYSSEPTLWVRSANVWYKLTKPAKEYARTHDLARRRFELSARIFILLTTLSAEDSTYRGVAHLLACPYLDMKGYSEKEILAEKHFIMSQFSTLTDPLVRKSPFLRDLKNKKTIQSKKSISSKPKKNPSPAASPAPSPVNGHPAPDLPWVPSANLDHEGLTKLMKCAEKAITSLFKMRMSGPFQSPVNPAEDGCPDYLERIARPMDYGTIKDKIMEKEYTSAADALEDARLVTSNCIKYNTAEHEFSKWALSLERKFETSLRKGEEAELAAMAKRATNKKRRASDMGPAKNSSKKLCKSSSRKGSKSSMERSPSSSSPFKEEESTPLKICARSEPHNCDKPQAPSSKYCSEACGLMVARHRLTELSKAGFNPNEYVRAHITKTLVRSRS